MKISDKEWSVLEALWAIGPNELGQITELLRTKNGWSINTVHTYLTRMEAKGMVEINKDVIPHTYTARLKKDECQRNERRSFLHRVYNGSTSDMIAAFLKEEKISDEEREKLKRILDNMEV